LKKKLNLHAVVLTTRASPSARCHSMWQCQNHSPGLLAWNLITMNELASMTYFRILSLIFFRWERGESQFFFPLASKPRPLRASSQRPLPSRSPRLFSPPGRFLFDITAVRSHSIKRAIEREEACHLPPLRTAAPAAAEAQKKDKKLNHLDTKLTVTSLASIGSSFVFPAS